ncbi:MAG: hypothetical protein PHX83_11345 [Acidobacteriia bacterium]|nr:hypothetical protein [Terriglobia bacterium]
MPDEKPQPPAATAPVAAPPKPATPPAAAHDAHPAPPAPPKKKKAEGILVKKPGQWTCLVKDEKGKNCEGKLKRYYATGEDVVRQAGSNAELYRCMECHSLYRPENPGHDPAARWSEV